MKQRDLPGCLLLIGALAVVLFAAMHLSSCSPAAVQASKKSGECAAIRAFFDDAQTKLIDSGACDASSSIDRCVAHTALEEAFIASLEANKCPSQKKHSSSRPSSARKPL